jgi:hypothetical protein
VSEVGTVELSLRIGPGTPPPAPGRLMRALRNVEVTQQDSAPCGFQLTFSAEIVTGEEPFSIVDDPLLAPFNRVLVRTAVDGVASTLIDGFITHQQYLPANGPPGSSFVVTGEDVSVKLDMVDWSREFPAFPDAMTAEEILAPWAVLLGLLPEVVPTPTSLVPVQSVPQQAETDRALLLRLAQQNGYIFYVRPGEEPFTNVAYWGPPQREEAPGALLDVAVGAASSVDSMQAQYNALAPVTYFGYAIETLIEPFLPVPILTIDSSRTPPLSSEPALTIDNLASLSTRHELWRQDQLDPITANLRAQALTDISTDGVVQASCEVSVARLGKVIAAPGMVGVRGVGHAYDGLYYLKSATHRIGLGHDQGWDYTQQLTMTREGVGATTSTMSSG